MKTIKIIILIITTILGAYFTYYYLSTASICGGPDSCPPPSYPYITAIMTIVGGIFGWAIGSVINSIIYKRKRT
ncbi:MAG: hypothetical protein Q7S37_03525 [bacterium]|nr:hypothetical protein [bacterium]